MKTVALEANSQNWAKWVTFGQMGQIVALEAISHTEQNGSR